MPGSVMGEEKQKEIVPKLGSREKKTIPSILVSRADERILG